MFTPSIAHLPHKEATWQLHPPQNTLEQVVMTLEEAIKKLSLTKDGQAFLAIPPQTQLQARIQQRLQNLDAAQVKVIEAAGMLTEAIKILQQQNAAHAPMVEAKQGGKRHG